MGIVSSIDLLEYSEQEIHERLEEQGLTGNDFIPTRINGEEKPSEQLILSFQRHSLPSGVKTGNFYCTVKPFMPNPQRCYLC